MDAKPIFTCCHWLDARDDLPSESIALFATPRLAVSSGVWVT